MDLYTLCFWYAYVAHNSFWQKQGAESVCLFDLELQKSQLLLVMPARGAKHRVSASHRIHLAASFLTGAWIELNTSTDHRKERTWLSCPPDGPYDALTRTMKVVEQITISNDRILQLCLDQKVSKKTNLQHKPTDWGRDHVVCQKIPRRLPHTNSAYLACKNISGARMVL